MKRKWMFRILVAICISTLLLWWASSTISVDQHRVSPSEDYSLRRLTQQLNSLSSYLPIDDVTRKFKKSLQNISCNLNFDKVKYDPDAKLNVSGLILRQGYQVEEYTVPTKDGFLLGLQRIPHGRRSQQVVFLQHGLGGSAANWVENMANESLGFLLADAGFDVWLGNVRGTTYSLKHRRLKQTDKEFWNWSWDAMALYDLPAMINYVLDVSHQKNLFYVGHSQGTLIAFAALSQNKDLNKKVKMFFALAPVAAMSNITSPIRYFADYHLVKPFMDALSMLHIYSFFPDVKLSHTLTTSVCANDKSAMLCHSVYFIIAGYDCKHMNHSRFQVYSSNSPSTTSLYNLNHLSQMVLSGELSMYDYGILGNFYHYRQTKPPNYDLENIQTPVALFWGGNDMLADPTDVKKLRSKLKNIAFDSYIKQYNHLDFIWSMDAADVVYKDILTIMKKY
ncbi:gastric triacylglycerol lipase-like isoform X2 [Antedon mediterranea]|uniref:gastric triacylglycerol lipase-like isoform X2 n=1 Tax=Antedon mediterranea TaxID=105859 RepID=UPI003AF5B15C